MNKYRVTFDALGSGNNKTVVQITVQAESDFMAQRIAEGQAKHRSPSLRNCEFVLRKVEKVS